MRLKNIIAVLSFVAATSLTAGISSAWAAGLGTVNMGYLEQRHPSYQQSVATYKSYAVKCQEAFSQQAKGKSEQERKQLQRYYQKQLEEEG